MGMTKEGDLFCKLFAFFRLLTTLASKLLRPSFIFRCRSFVPSFVSFFVVNDFIAFFSVVGL